MIKSNLNTNQTKSHIRQSQFQTESKLQIDLVRFIINKNSKSNLEYKLKKEQFYQIHWHQPRGNEIQRRDRG